jgi:hypothetical protein
MVVAGFVFSIFAVLAAVASAVWAALARGDAKRSADAAEEAVKLDRRATEILEQQRAEEIQAAELTAVVWRFMRGTGAMRRFVNVGTDHALDVTVAGQRVYSQSHQPGSAAESDVAPGEGVEFMERGAIQLNRDVLIEWKRAGAEKVHALRTVLD